MTHLTPEQLEAPGDSPHLAECAQCRDGVRLAAGRRKLLGAMKPYTLADVAFSRVDAKLQEHVRENPPGARWAFGRVLAFATMAAVVAMFAVTTVRPLLDNYVAPPPPAAFEALTVVHASGAVSVKAGAVLGRDAVLDATQGQVMLATSDGASLRLGGGAKFRLGMQDSTVQMLGGTLSADMKRGGPWVVSAALHWVKSSDASFDVAADTLRLYRGSVLLADNAAFNNARTVNAPASVTLHDMQVMPLVGGPAFAMRASSPAPWARLELQLPASEVELDGLGVGGAPLSLMTSPGKHKLRAHIGDAWRETDLDLKTGELGVVEFPGKVAISPIAPAENLGEADPAAIAAAVKAQLPKLRVCHEKWLKVNESARGKVMMSITVSPRGKVTKTSFTSDEGVPEAVNECLGRAARSMKLPASSEEVELEVPVVLGGAQ